MKKVEFFYIIFYVFFFSFAHGALVHQYTFSNDANDVVGGADGTLVGTAAVTGGQLVLDGSGHVDLPAATIAMNTYSAVTLESWVTLDSATPNWSMIGAFGLNDGSGTGLDYLMLQGKRGDNGAVGAVLSDDYWNSEAWTSGSVHTDGIPVHLAATIDATTLTLYVNGVLSNSVDLGGRTLADVSNANAYLGKSVYGDDATSVLSINEFRIYDTALSETEITDSYAVGIPHETGVSIDKAMITVEEEGPTSETISIVLASEPAEDVVIDLEDLAQTEQVSLDPATLTFTPSNWDTTQTVQVTAVDDSVSESAQHSTSIAFTVSSADPDYNNFNVNNIIVTILDNDCGAWGYALGDLNKDCVVDSDDLVIMASNWLLCSVPYEPGCVEYSSL